MRSDTPCKRPYLHPSPTRRSSDLMQAEGAALEVAIREAGRVRLRPILMTTLCTLFGLLPLALGIGAGNELQRPNRDRKSTRLNSSHRCNSYAVLSLTKKKSPSGWT